MHKYTKNKWQKSVQIFRSSEIDKLVGFFWKKHSKNLWFGTKTRKVLSVGRSRLHKKLPL